MSYREKHLLISIASTVLIWGVYFQQMAMRIADGGLARQSFVTAMGGLFVLCLILVVAIELALRVVAWLTTSKAERQARDEREARATWKAGYASLMLLIGLVISLATLAYLMGFGMVAAPEGPRLQTLGSSFLVLSANVMLACVVVSELFRFAMTFVLIRRGR